MLLRQYLAVDLEDRGSRIVQQRLDFGIDRAELGQQFAHVLCAAARSRLIGHRGHPLDQILLEQPAQTHQHARHGAITANVVLHAARQRILDHVQVDRIKHNDRVILHAQRGSGIDPVAVPAGCTQLREDLGRIVATLAGDDDVALLQLINIVGVLQRGFVLRHRRRLAACVRCREEHRLDMIEITLFLHALHQDRTHHATPTHQTN